MNVAVRENTSIPRITHSFGSTDSTSVYAHAPTSEVAVSVVDNDMPRVLVTETDGVTRLVQGQAGDSYTLRLVSQPPEKSLSICMATVKPSLSTIRASSSTIWAEPLRWT
jgi:hypothetical protein